MKRQLLAFACATLFGCSIASAADLAVRKAPPPPAPISSWTGFYIGAHVGTGWGTTELEFKRHSPFGPYRRRRPTDSSAASKAATICNSAHGGGRHRGAILLDRPQWHVTVRAGRLVLDRPRLVGTIAARFGVTYDRLLLYVKAGYAWSKTNYNAASFSPTSRSAPASATPARDRCLALASSMRSGTWSAKIEYNYIDFGKDDFSFPLGGGSVNVAVQEVNASCEGGSELQVRRRLLT